MPRKPREDVEGGVHHVYARGNGRHDIYLDDGDRRTYLAMLGRVVMRKRWRCLAYCLMDNHVHLLVETVDANLGQGMQRLHSSYAQTFNARHGRSGHVFQGRYGAARMTDDAQLYMAAAYIARNPVAAGLCELPEQWRWSSFAAVLGGSAPGWLDVTRLLSYFDPVGGEPRQRYVELVAAGAPRMGASGSEPAISRAA
jgi:REP element-mobilizing transposase RayT